MMKTAGRHKGGKRRRNIRAISGGVALFDFLDYRAYLGAVYAEIKTQERSYTYLEFAADLGFSPTNVVRLVIAGQRRLTPLTSERIATALELKTKERRYFSALVKYINARQGPEREALFQRLLAVKRESLANVEDQIKLEYFSEWYHPVIREMAGMAHFRSDPLWILSRLEQSLLPRQITKSLELLTKLGLIEWDAALGRHVQTPGQNTTDRFVDNLAAVRCHQKLIELGREAITRVAEQRREIHAVTVRIDERIMDKIKAAVIKTCEDVMAMEAEAGDQADQIYQLNLQFFPLTRPQRKD